MRSRAPISTAIPYCRGDRASSSARAPAAPVRATARTAAATCSALRTASEVKKPWLIYALITTVFWGVWGAFAEFPTRHGFPETLVYVVWALTMIPPALYAMQRAGWRVLRDPKSILLGSLIGLTGAGGQMLLFHAVHTGPTYLIFPIIALSPVITIALSMLFLKERVTRVGALGVVLALIALPLFNYSSAGEAGAVLTDAASAGASGPQGVTWFVYALIILLAWGVQAYFMKLANGTMDAENIFLYMTLTGLALIPVALWMTDFGVAKIGR